MWKKAALVFGPLTCILVLNAAARIADWVRGPAPTAVAAPEPDPPEEPAQPDEVPPDDSSEDWSGTIELADLSSFVLDHDETKMVIAGNSATGLRHCEPNAWVWVVGNDNELQFDGECGQIQVTGNGNELTADHAEHIKLTGNNNELKVGETESVALLGNGNEVSYRTSLEGSAPKLIESGRDNELVALDPEPEPEPEAEAEAEPPPEPEPPTDAEGRR